jgi:hypothetical protein
MRRMRPVRGEPAAVMSDQQARLSCRKRRCRTPRAVCRWRFIGSSERTEPIAQIRAPVATATHSCALIAPADRRDGYCLIVFFQQIGLVIVNTVQFSTHCDQI